jgi:hypothetical protein
VKFLIWNSCKPAAGFRAQGDNPHIAPLAASPLVVTDYRGELLKTPLPYVVNF